MTTENDDRARRRAALLKISGTGPAALEAECRDLARELIESRRHTAAQLAEWGVSWPPIRGWKAQLIEEWTAKLMKRETGSNR